MTNDIISRQAVMDAAKTVMKDTLDSLPTRLEDGEEVYDVRTSELDFILNINKALQNAIKSLPSETHEIRTETHGVCSDDLISRQAAIRWVKTECNPYGKPTLDFESGKKVIEHLEQMPSADRPQGEWVFDTQIPISGGGSSAGYRCSLCGRDYFHVDGMNFCPNCGSYNGGWQSD